MISDEEFTLFSSKIESCHRCKDSIRTKDSLKGGTEGDIIDYGNLIRAGEIFRQNES